MVTCEACGDLGWQRYDVAYGDPKFGQLRPCDSCRIVQTRRVALLEQADTTPANLASATFATFDRTPLHVAKGFQAVQRFARDVIATWVDTHTRRAAFAMPEQWAVVLWGPPGCGKTHLGVAFAAAARKAQIPALFCECGRLWEWLGCTQDWDPDVSYTSRMTAVATVPVLVLDELGGYLAANGGVKLTDAMLTRRQKLIRYRYEKRLPTLVLDNRNPDTWGDDPIVDRLLAFDNVCLPFGSNKSYRRYGEGGAA